MTLTFKIFVIILMSSIWAELSGIRKALEKNSERRYGVMAHCEKCISYDMCNYEYEHQDPDTILTFFPNNTDCPWFKNKSDYAEVKHGEWIEKFKDGFWYYDCPFCDDGYVVMERDENKPNYCHNCGAKMDGGKME